MTSVNMWAYEVILHRGFWTQISCVNKQGRLRPLGQGLFTAPHQELPLIVGL